MSSFQRATWVIAGSMVLVGGLAGTVAAQDGTPPTAQEPQAPSETPSEPAQPVAAQHEAPSGAAQPTVAQPAAPAPAEQVRDDDAASEPDSPAPGEARPAAPAPAAPAGESVQEPVWYGNHPVDPTKARWVPGKGIEFNSQDGLFRLQARMRAQFRYDYEKDAPADWGDGEQAFMIRRARVVFSGHWWGADNAFKMELAVSPRDLGMTRDQALVDAEEDGTPTLGEVGAGTAPISSAKANRISRSPLLDFYVQFKQIRDLNLRIGQYKTPFSRQRVVSSGNLMFVDRFILNGEFTVDRDIGFDFRSKDLFGLGGKLKYYAGVWAGEGHSSYRFNDFGMMYIVRAEYLPMGAFKDYHESALSRPSSPKMSVGAAYAYVGNAKGQKGILGKPPADGLTTDTHNVNADVLFKWHGLSAQGEFYMREGKRPSGATEAPRDGWGAGGQVGYLLPWLDFEIAARYAAIRGRGETIMKDQNEVGGALSYYFARHPYKLQADYLRLWGEDIHDNGVDQFRIQLQTSF